MRELTIVIVGIGILTVGAMYARSRIAMEENQRQQAYIQCNLAKIDNSKCLELLK